MYSLLYFSTLNQKIMYNIPNSIDGITFDKGYTARVIITGEDIRKQIAKHRQVDFVSSVIGLARYEPTTGEWFLTIPSFNLKGKEVEAMPGKDLDFHQNYLTQETQDSRSIFPPNFDFAAFAQMKTKVRVERAKLLAVKK